MRIALLNFLFPPLGIGGSEQSVYYLATGLQRLGHDVRVFSQNTQNETVEEEVSGVAVTRLASLPGREPNVLNESIVQREVKRREGERRQEVGTSRGHGQIPHTGRLCPAVALRRGAVFIAAVRPHSRRRGP